MNKEDQENKDNDWVNDPEMQDFLEHVDKQGPWDSEDDRIHTVGGLTNDKEGSFMKFQNKINKAYKHGWEIQAEQIELILTEANAHNLRNEVKTTAEMFIKDDPELEPGIAYEMAYMQWIKN
tara:strand:+ start:787 stop:1152 length:366 start_codon:yes stop_codon:yes gene_type:complete